MKVESLARYEMKFAVTPGQLSELQRTLRRYCVLDGYYLPEKKNWCSVHSLYFDTPRWRFYQAGVSREVNRLKLRVRTYPDCPGAVAKVEVKRRVKDVVMKTSTVVPGEDWPRWLETGQDLSELPEEPRESLQEFLTLERSLDARPKILVRYQRQAYRSLVDDYARVTFDREICYQPMERHDVLGSNARWTPLDGGHLGAGAGLVMELKFRQRPPVWMADMVVGMGLTRRGFSKYCKAVQRQLQQWKPWGDLAPAGQLEWGAAA